MKKKLGILFILGVCALVSGCGAKLSKQEKQGQKNDNAAQVYVTPIPCSKEELIQKYPDWFDAKGNIVYPLQPDSKEFDKRCEEVGYDKAKEEANMPEDLVKRLDTKTLLQTVEDNPFFTTMQMYESIDSAIENILLIAYGSEELSKREDAYHAAYQVYTKRVVKPTKLKNDEDGEGMYENAKLMARVLLEEYLLLQEHSYRKLTTAERKEVKQAVQRNRKAEQEMHNAGYDPPCHYESPHHTESPDGIYYDDYSYNLEVLIDQDGNPWKDYLSQ